MYIGPDCSFQTTHRHVYLSVDGSLMAIRVKYVKPQLASCTIAHSARTGAALGSRSLCMQLAVCHGIL